MNQVDNRGCIHRLRERQNFTKGFWTYCDRDADVLSAKYEGTRFSVGAYDCLECMEAVAFELLGELP